MALANEWAKHGINVNAIAPGYMATDNTAPLRADPPRAARRSWHASRPDGGDADDLKGCVVFLASRASTTCTAPSCAWTADGWHDRLPAGEAIPLPALLHADIDW